MCAYYVTVWSVCREEIQCSGHGLCLGKTCTCDTGYASSNISYPGPFCNKIIGSGLTGAPSTGIQSDDRAKTTLLLIVAPVLGGAIICCVFSLLWCSRKRNRIKKLKKNILEFPQPQLAVPAEKRQHEIIMIPDETGWSEVEYIAGKLNPVDEKVPFFFSIVLAKRP